MNGRQKLCVAQVRPLTIREKLILLSKPALSRAPESPSETSPLLALSPAKKPPSWITPTVIVELLTLAFAVPLKTSSTLPLHPAGSVMVCVEPAWHTESVVCVNVPEMDPLKEPELNVGLKVVCPDAFVRMLGVVIVPADAAVESQRGPLDVIELTWRVPCIVTLLTVLLLRSPGVMIPDGKVTLTVAGVVEPEDCQFITCAEEDVRAAYPCVVLCVNPVPRSPTKPYPAVANESAPVPSSLFPADAAPPAIPLAPKVAAVVPLEHNRKLFCALADHASPVFLEVLPL